MMKRALFIMSCLGVCAFVIPALAAAEADATLIGTYEGWNAYHFMQREQKVCFISAQPQKQEGKFKKRGDVAFFVTLWPGQKESNVISVSNGYTFKEGGPVKLAIADKKFDLFSEGDTAWTKDEEMNTAVMAALQTGGTMVIEGVSKRGTLTTDTYDLKGSMEAYQAVTRECGGDTKVNR